MQTLDNDPEWDHILTVTATPAALIRVLFTTATDVHTGWSSCVDGNLAASDLIAADERSGNYVRLVEQEFFEDEDPNVLWHDWAVEIRIGEVFVTGHWQIQVSGAPFDWEWSKREAETAFDRAAVLVGKRVRQILAIEEEPETPPEKSKHH